MLDIRDQYTEEAPKIKWVKKASQYCLTWFERDKLGKLIQKQKWVDEDQLKETDKK